ncbi:hypothetical protein HQQ80_06990 [Microbacteriaceae bacterium VKM Ac-2855]|nr:hypothetical protein [Microbacteriaceae bacterium VKM Ac-2855]
MTNPNEIPAVPRPIDEARACRVVLAHLRNDDELFAQVMVEAFEDYETGIGVPALWQLITRLSFDGAGLLLVLSGGDQVKATTALEDQLAGINLDGPEPAD